MAAKPLMQWMLVAVVLPLVACKQNGPASTGAGDASANNGAAADTAKVRAYGDAYNELIGTNGLPWVYSYYVREDVLHKPLTDNIMVNDGFLEVDLKKFKDARAMPGNVSPEMQSAGDAVIQTLGAAYTRVHALDAYYSSKTYREDKMARGRSENAAMIDEFRAATKAQDDFGAVLDNDLRRRDDILLTSLKAKGHMLAYENRLALRQSGDLVKMFPLSNNKALTDASLYAKADVQVAAIEKTLVDERAELEKAKANPKNQVPGILNMLPVDLTSMVGSYRDLKQSHRPPDLDMMIEAYNHAVDAANSAY